MSSPSDSLSDSKLELMSVSISAFSVFSVSEPLSEVLSSECDLLVYDLQTVSN